MMTRVNMIGPRIRLVVHVGSFVVIVIVSLHVALIVGELELGN